MVSYSHAESQDLPQINAMHKYLWLIVGLVALTGALKFALLFDRNLRIIVVVQGQQNAIYVPFAWNAIPLTATSLGSSEGTTTYGLLDGPKSTLGPGE